MTVPRDDSRSMSAVLERCADEWRAATRHAFLDSVRDGSLDPHTFDLWLAQDYLYVADLLGFPARLLARAPGAGQAVLAAGLVGLERELGWFEGHAVQRGLRLNVAREPATQQYARLFERLNEAAYGVGIVALWAIER